MFTGIVEEVGVVHSVGSNQLVIKAQKILSDVHLGDSIAVNGVCLTVVNYTYNTFTVDVMPETFRCSSLGGLNVHSFVNLERALPANGRFGGHIVSGHIDGTGVINQITKEDNAVLVEIIPPEILKNNIISKGSIAIDGVSLTVAHLTSKGFVVSIIPHTGENTILLSKNKGDIVNLEGDLIGKYVAHLIGMKNSDIDSDALEDFINNDIYGNKSNLQKSNITMDFLTENGF